MTRYTTCTCCGFTVASHTVKRGLCPLCTPRRNWADLLLLWTVITVNLALWAGIFYFGSRFLGVF